MVNQFIPQSSLLLGIIPALTLLYLSLKDWHGKFVEKTLYIMFIIGIISGFIVVIIQTTIILTFEVLIIYPFLEQIIKTMILNLRRFQEKQSTIIYGLALGLGFGSVYPPASMLLVAETVSNMDILMILLRSIGILFLHGASGALIGYGIFKGKIINYYLYAVFLLLAAYLFRVEYMLQGLTLVFGIIVYWFIQRKFMQPTVKELDKRTRSNKPTP